MSFTTNEDDQRKAAALQKRLADAEDEDNIPSQTLSKDFNRIPNVNIAEGAHKYVLISALLPGTNERQNFVVSKRGAQYHQHAADPFVELLERNDYKNIRVSGGGRIALDNEKKTISIYGYSYGFGLADHALSKAVVCKDDRYSDYEVTWTNDGY